MKIYRVISKESAFKSNWLKTKKECNQIINDIQSNEIKKLMFGMSFEIETATLAI